MKADSEWQAAALLTEWADRHRWTFAKTSKWPHEYVAKVNTDPAEFDRMGRIIRRFGVPRRFFRPEWTNVYWTVAGYRYWTMGPLDVNGVINRCPEDEPWYGRQDAADTTSPVETIYDRLASQYDTRYSTEECHAQDRHVKRWVESLGRADTTIDLGAGTGLALDLGLASLRFGYTAVDPSQAMLNELVLKHPTVRHVIPDTALGAMTDGRLTPAPRVLALFGAPSYFGGQAVQRIPTLIAGAGFAFLMFYREGYLPDYHRDDPAVHALADESREALADTPGVHTTVEWEDFVVTVIRRA